MLRLLEDIWRVDGPFLPPLDDKDSFFVVTLTMGGWIRLSFSGCFSFSGCLVFLGFEGGVVGGSTPENTLFDLEEPAASSSV